MGNPQVMCFGEALIDEIYSADSSHAYPRVGGSPLNVACGLSRLGHRVLLSSWWGKDSYGEKIERYLQDQGVAVAAGTANATKTSVAKAYIGQDGSAHYTFDVEWDVVQWQLTDTAGHIHIGSYSALREPGASKIRDILKKTMQASTSYDINIRPSLIQSPEQVREQVAQLLPHIDLVKASDEDMAWLYGTLPEELPELMETILNMGPRVVVVTRGSQGALVKIAGHESLISIAPTGDSVVDTVGAGDSFMAGIISGLMDAGLLGSAMAAAGLTHASKEVLETAFNRGASTAGVTVGHAGAYSPTRAEING